MVTPLRAALAYAEHGWRVAPAGPGKKHPYLKDWQERASADPNTVAHWFCGAGSERMNVCIATGQESGIWVLDCDDCQQCGKTGSVSLAALEAKYAPLPATYSVGTGSGGVHYYFSWQGVDFDLRNSAGKLGKDLDTRGAGGQVVAPPSRASDPHHFQRYTLLAGIPPVPAPAWLLELLRPAERFLGPRPEQFYAGSGDGILGWLATLRPGEQDNGLAWVVRALRDEGKTAQEAGDLLWPVVSAWECSRGPWTEQDIERHLRSAY